MCGSKNYPYLPHGRDFSFDPPPPHLSGNTSQGPHIYLNFWAFETPPPPRNFQFLLWADYGYFPELHISISSSSLGYDNKRRKLILSTPGTWMLKKRFISFQNGASWINVQSKRKCLSGLTNKYMNEFEIGPWVWNTFTCINITLGVKVIQ